MDDKKCRASHALARVGGAQGYDGLMRNKRVVVPGWSNKLLRFIVSAAPKRIVLAATDRGIQSRAAPRPRWPKRPDGARRR